MKKLILLLAATLLFIGCEDDDSSTDNNLTLLNKVGIVQFVNESGGTRTVVTQGGNELSFVSAQIYQLRSSGSGFSSANVNVIGVGDTVDYYFYHEQVDYIANPNQVPVVKIYIYNVGNVNATPPTAND